MGIPLWIFLAIWGIIAFLVGVSALLATMMLMKYGLSGKRTVFLSLIFLSVPAAVILGTISYAMNTDWSQTLTIFELSQR